MCVRGPLFLAFWWVRSGETAEPLGETRQIDKAIGPLRHTGPSAFLLATFSFFLSCWGDTPRGGTPSPRLPPAESGTASALPGTSAAGGASPRSVTTGGRDPAARLPLRSRCPPISSPKGPQGGQPPVVWVRAGGPERCCEAGGLSSSQERACEPGGGGTAGWGPGKETSGTTAEPATDSRGPQSGPQFLQPRFTDLETEAQTWDVPVSHHNRGSWTPHSPRVPNGAGGNRQSSEEQTARAGGQGGWSHSHL